MCDLCYVDTSRLRAPKWLKCPSCISFGFGGKLVSCRPSLSSSGAACGSEVYVHNVVTEDSLVKRSAEFEAAAYNGEKSALRLLCERKSEESEFEDDKEAWAFLKIMFEDDGMARTKLLGHLGFCVSSTENENLSELTSNLSLDDSTAKTTGLVEGMGGGASHIDNGDEFFSNAQTFVESFSIDGDVAPNGEQGFQETQETQESEKVTDESVLHALIVADYTSAVQHCMSANRVTDALIIANASGPSSGPPLWESTRDKYLDKSHVPYLKVISALIKNDLMALVNTRPPSSWKETLALLCTFAQKEEWTELCDCLASRLVIAGTTLAATLCYICSGNIDKTVEIWSCKLTSENGGRAYSDLLQDLMEKVIVVALATGQKQFSASLSKLFEKYAELLISQGLLTTAMRWLKLLGIEDSSEELVIWKSQILLSVEDNEPPKTHPIDGALHQPESKQVPEQLAAYSQDNMQFQPPILRQYKEPYSQQMYPQQMASYPVYQLTQQKKRFPDYANPAPFQPVPSRQMFLPSHTPQIHQMPSGPPVPTPHPVVRSFIPSTPPALRNVEQYRAPTMGSQLYAGGVPSPYLSHQGTLVGSISQIANISNMKFSRPVTPTPTPGDFTPVTNPGFVQSTGWDPVQPSSTSQVTHTQSQAVRAPPAPPSTVQTVDTSNVSAQLRPVITTLTSLYNETSEALGGSRANPAKKREIDDNSRKLGSLFAKLNNQDISSNAASKLVQLCQALDNRDFPGALHVQVVLTTTEWDECSFWLAALKRMIKIRQSMTTH